MRPWGTPWAYRDAPGAAALGELEAEAALAHPGVGHDAHRSACALHGCGERALQGLGLVASSHEGREAAAARDVEARAQGPHALQGGHPDGEIRSLHLELTQVLQLEVPVHARGGLLGQVGLAGLGERLHPRSQPDGVPLGGVVHAQVVTDLPDHDLS
jgi:hypothetical protein